MLRNLGASGLAISVFASLSATAQNVGLDNASTQIQLRLQQEPIASRFPDDFQQFYERYGFNIRVPVNIEDASERIHMARISCEVVSSLTANGSVVGSGTALILPDSGEPVEEREVHENYRLAHWIAGDLLNGFNQCLAMGDKNLACFGQTEFAGGAVQQLCR